MKHLFPATRLLSLSKFALIFSGDTLLPPDATFIAETIAIIHANSFRGIDPSLLGD
jgi:hypothetical protein